MRFHVLGLGPVGQLVASHLRRVLSPKHTISLMFKNGALARRMRNYPLHVEYEGVVNSATGFETESTASPFRMESAVNSQVARSAKYDTAGQNILSAATESPITMSPNTRFASNGTEEDNHIDSLFVTCKAQSTLDAIKQVEHRLSPSSTITLLQNGNLATHELLLQRVFQETSRRPNFILVSNTHGVWLKRAPFHIVHAGIGQLRFGIVPDGRRDFEKNLHSGNGTMRLSLDDIALPRDDPDVARYRSLRNTVAVLQKLSGLQSTWIPFFEMQISLRQKLVVNSVINPLTAILGCRNGEIFECEEGERMAYRICKEASRVFKKEVMTHRDPALKPDDVYLPPELSLRGLLTECQRVARVTENNTSSMLADLKKGGKLTEVDFLTGHLLTLGRRYREPMPVNACMLDLVKMRAEIPLDTIV